MSLYCNASNSDSKIASSRKLVLNVRYKPETNILINSNKSYNDYYMIRNSPINQSLQCEVRGGNPHANLTWTCYEAKQTHFNTPMGATSVVTWMAGTHEDSECVCTASHILGWSAAKKVSVHVLYPPSEPTCELGTAIVSGGTINISLSSNVTMTCTSDASPEQSTFVWTLPNGMDVNGNELFLHSFQMDYTGVYSLQIENTMRPSQGDTIQGRRNATFFLCELHPPRIANLNTTLKVLEGENISLSCDAEPGNPNNTFYSWGSTQHPDRNTTDQELIINNISRTDAGVYICFAWNIMHPTGFPIKIGSDKRNVTVDVQYPATLPIFFSSTCTNINSFVNGDSIKVVLGEPLWINCSAYGNPSPAYFWSESLESSQLYIENVSINHASEMFCTANNTMNDSYGKSVSSSMTSSFYLDILHPPKITNLNTTIRVLEGINFSLSCDAYPGNPNNTSYSWTSSHQPEQNTTDQELIFNNISRTDAGVYICFAQNRMQPTGCDEKIGSDKKTIAIDVQYPATLPIFFSSTCTHINSFVNGDSIKVVLGEPLWINCSARGNPSPAYFWCNRNQSSQFYIKNVSINHASEYFCTANNTMNDSYGKSVSSSMTSSFYLDVLHPPKIANINTTFEVVEGVDFNVTCYAEPGNPNVTSYFWTSEEMPERNTSDQYLIIHNISRADEGRFTCSVNNIMHPTGCPSKNGNDAKSVYVDVQYKASITRFAAENRSVYHGDKLMFSCEVESDPPANISMLTSTGSLLRYVHGNNQLHYTKTSSCLEDIGQFTCVSVNKHNRDQSDISHVIVDVKCSPMYPTDYKPITTMNSRLGEEAVFNFSVFSNPPPTHFTWTNISNNMQIPTDKISGRVSVINTTDDMSSALIITSVEPWDSGYYSVSVANEIGNKTETFHILVEIKSTTMQPSTINIGAVIGGSVSAITGVVIIAVVVVFVLFRRMQTSKGNPHHDNNKMQLLQATCHKSEKMEMESFDHVLPINDETPKYEEDKSIYGNLQLKNAFGKSLTIKTLRDTVRELKLDPVPLFKEFYTLQMGLQYDTKNALKPNNVAKNRYRSVYPYDASRVVLPLLSENPDSDFINASYIDGYCKPRKYIAAQGPLENTNNDTWRMIHSEDIKIIVMVTNLIETGKRKCFKYWPDDRATYGKCNVKLDQVEEYADFVVRHFTFSMEETRFERQLVQFHFTSWPDKNVPATALSLVQFWRKVRQSKFVEHTPWMVHCSAGVGRTGTFIALDYLYDQGKVDGKLNVPETVNVLREQRISMVQTKEQYLYLHEAITELLDPVGQIFTPENSLRLQSTSKEDKKLKIDFKAITNSIVSVKTDFEENDYDLKRMPDGQLPENICKSIDQTVIPDDLFRPLISTGRDFINAVYIPTYRDAEKYIVTQFPFHNTIVDFVRLLWYHNIQDVVLIDDGSEKRDCYWPHNNTPLSIGPFVISLLSEDETNHCTTRRIDIAMAEQRQSKQTVIHQFTAWPGYLNLCETKALTEFLQRISRIVGPVVVQCHDGYSRSGLFAALLSIVDRIKTDKEVAIADTVRMVKHRRQQAVTDVEQYQFCHEVVFEYLKGREAHTEERDNQEYVNMTFPKFL